MSGERIITGLDSGRKISVGEALIRGSCGMVFSGTDGERAVTIKVPHPIDDPTHIHTLAKESRLQAAVQHPHITPVVLFDTSEDFEPGMQVPFLVTPLAKTDLLTLTS